MVSQSNKEILEEMKNSPFHQLFLKVLNDIYWAEKQLVNALPTMSEASTSSKLSSAINSHLEEKIADELLNKLAKSEINEKAMK